jgi:hypothetical protein
LAATKFTNLQENCNRPRIKKHGISARISCDAYFRGGKMKLHPRSPKIWIASSAAALVLTSALVAPAFADHDDASSRTKTPIKHVVIIFG